MFQHAEICPCALGLLTKVASPVAGTRNPFHELHQVAAEIPQTATPLQVAFGMGHQACDHVRGFHNPWSFAIDQGIHRCPAQRMCVGGPANHRAVAVNQSRKALLRGVESSVQLDHEFRPALFERDHPLVL